MVTADANHSAPSQGGLLPVTPAHVEGPFFRIGAPRRDSLIEPGVAGERVLVTGRALTTQGKSIAEALTASVCSATHRPRAGGAPSTCSVRRGEHPDPRGKPAFELDLGAQRPTGGLHVDRDVAARTSFRTLTGNGSWTNQPPATGSG